MKPRAEIGVVGDPRRVKARHPGQIDLVVGERRRGVAIGAGHPADLLDRGRPGDVLLVGPQHEVGPLGSVDGVRAAADERVRGLPGLGGIGRWRDDERRRRGRDLDEVRRRMAEADDEGRVVGRLDGDLVLAGVTGHARRRALDDAQDVGRRGLGRRIQEAEP